MKILELNEVMHLLPDDVDFECVSICNTLNTLSWNTNNVLKVD